jgi:hypothetical protein
MSVVNRPCQFLTQHAHGLRPRSSLSAPALIVVALAVLPTSVPRRSRPAPAGTLAPLVGTVLGIMAIHLSISKES